MAMVGADHLINPVNPSFYSFKHVGGKHQKLHVLENQMIFLKGNSKNEDNHKMYQPNSKTMLRQAQSPPKANPKRGQSHPVRGQNNITI